VVTGGARGLGLGIGRALLDAAVVDRVVAWDLHPDQAPEEITPGLAVVGCDVQVEASVRACFEALGETPTVLVNNAGGGRFDREPDPDALPFDPFGPVEAWRESVDLNLTAAHIVTRVVGPHLQRGAAICNVASIAGQTANALFAYAAAKAGIIHWTRCLALAVAGRGVRVNAVAPGFIYTRAWQALAPDKALFDAVVGGRVPLGTEQSATDIGQAVAFLCSAAAGQITGQCLAIDGGATLGQPLVGGD
jgi:NAD(P)-dependent dehydrogenase (short-subunit alcohol dehydrogenase family)